METEPVANSFEALSTWREHAGGWVGEVPGDWMQGRAAFGGLISAAALRVMRARVGEERPARSLYTQFLAPVGPGEARMELQLLRSGRSLSTLEARVFQGEELKAVLMGSFGADRSSVVEVPGAARPQARPPDEVAELPFIPGVTPRFTQHLAYRITEGDMPFSGSRRGLIGGWCRHRTAAVSGPEAVVGLLDAWPAPVIPMLRGPAPASTVSWTAQLIDVPAQAPEGWWWFRSEVAQAGEGYARTHGELYRPDGLLAARMDQLVAVFG